MILSRAPPGLLNNGNKAVASSRCSSSVSGSTSAAGGVGQPHGAVFLSRRCSLRFSLPSSSCIRAGVGTFVEETAVANDQVNAAFLALLSFF